MRSFPECYPCILQHTLNAARMAGADPLRQAEILRQVSGVFASSEPSWSPAHIVALTNPIVCQVSGNSDPSLEARRLGIEQALALVPRLQELIAASADPLETALRLAIAGNIIDIIPGHTYDLWGVVQHALAAPIAGNSLEQFRSAVAAAQSILYLADNAGEAVFDRFLVEALVKTRRVLYAVKSGPVLNDATRQDAYAAGLDQVTTVIETGSDAPGTILELCSPEFLAHFRQADLVISKGQANYETLDAQGERVFFLMKVKCPLIAGQVKAQVNDLLLLQGG